jgi:hypothetical protein
MEEENNNFVGLFTSFKKDHKKPTAKKKEEKYKNL